MNCIICIVLQCFDTERLAILTFAFCNAQVIDTRPAYMQANYTDVSAVEKYVMPENEYEQRKDSVLQWKKTQKLGRFDPNAPSLEEQKVQAVEREVEERGEHS